MITHRTKRAFALLRCNKEWRSIICKLCLQARELQKSQVIPTINFKRLKQHGKLVTGQQCAGKCQQSDAIDAG